MKRHELFVAIALTAQSVPAAAQHMNLPNAPCRNAVVTVEAERCFVHATKAANMVLQQHLSRIRRILGPFESADLEKAQALWAQFREADCSAERDLFGRRTGGPVTYFACLEAWARMRLADLDAIYGWRLAK
jgi:uncharacterized protein YecT (DUF1311 family)